MGIVGQRQVLKRLRGVALAWGLLALGGCLGNVDFDQSSHFRCKSSSECLSGFECVGQGDERRCVRTSQHSDAVDAVELADQTPDQAPQDTPQDRVTPSDQQADSLDWTIEDTLADASDAGADQQKDIVLGATDAADQNDSGTVDATGLDLDSCDVDGCAPCVDHDACPQTHYCGQDGLCYPKVANGHNCVCDKAGCKSYTGKQDDPAQCSQGACVLDTVGEGTNPKGGYFCVAPKTCVDRESTGSNSATLYSEDEVFCGTGSGNLDYWVCKSGGFQGPVNCAVGPRGTQCGDVVGLTNYKTGSVIGACSKLLGCHETCQDCAPYVSDESGVCFDDCGKSTNSVIPDRCQNGFYCCTGNVSCTAEQKGTCLPKKSYGQTCESNSECKSGACIYLPGSGNEPICGCVKSSHCPGGSPKPQCCHGACLPVSTCPANNCANCESPSGCDTGVCRPDCPDGGCPWQ